MTEAQAKMKWCPLVRVIEDDGGNRSEKGVPAAALCIASECMAWRWGSTTQGFCGAFGVPAGEPR